MILSELSSGDILTVSSGDYSINENVLNHKRIKIIVPGVTVKLLGGNYTRAQIISTVDTVILLDGNVIFYGQAAETSNPAAGLFIENGKMIVNTNNNTMVIKDYNNGIRVGHKDYSDDAELYVKGGGNLTINGSVVVNSNAYSGGGYDDNQAATLSGQGAGGSGSGIMLLSGVGCQRILTVVEQIFL